MAGGATAGRPVSPLLSNILLDELDNELERRGHSFCRYADDCNIYVSSRKAGEHILKELRAFLDNKQKLTVNERKSAVAHPWERKFLGYSVTWHKQTKLKIAPASVKRLKGKVHSLTTGNRSQSRCTDTGAVRMDKLLQTDGSQGEYWRSWTAGSNGNCVAWCGGS